VLLESLQHLVLLLLLQGPLPQLLCCRSQCLGHSGPQMLQAAVPQHLLLLHWMALHWLLLH
jgi:hypothetical protein